MDMHRGDRPLFGISVTPNAEQYRQIVHQLLAAERGGLDLVGIQDQRFAAEIVPAGARANRCPRLIRGSPVRFGE